MGYLMTDQYIVGEMYFRITYPGRSMNYPNIQSFVFVGKNLSDEDAEDTWYFQFADSYAKFGSFLESQVSELPVACLTKDKLEHDMLDEDELLDALKSARERRRIAKTV
jgi:hypothetical protein